MKTSFWRDPALGHFSNGLFLCPALHRNTVQGTHDAGAVCAVLTMNKNWRPFRIRCDLEEPDHIFPFRVPCLHVDALILQTACSNFVSIGMKGTEIHRRFNSLPLQILHTLCCGLSTPIEISADLIQIGNSFEFGGLSPGCWTIRGRLVRQHDPGKQKAC